VLGTEDLLKLLPQTTAPGAIAGEVDHGPKIFAIKVVP
jgi:hypothetical protein